MTEAFPLQQFLDAFEVTTKVKNKLQPFIAKYKEHNMSWIMRSLEELHRLFFDQKVDLQLKFNSIFGIKFLFDTGEVTLINLIEIYFLPKITQIACYEVQIPNEKRGVSYFANQNYPKDTPELEKFGYNFVRMASEFVTAAAVVKPRKLFQVEELPQPSNYALAYKKLQQTGWKPYPTPVYYKQGTSQAIRTLFEKSISQLDNSVDTFINYYVSIYRVFMQQDKLPRARLDPHKIIEFGDSFVTAALVSLCEETFKQPSLKHKKNALFLLNDLIKWGDIESAHLVCCTELIDDIIKEIANPELGSKNLTRGKAIYKGNTANEALKQEFYVQFLKAIQFWALCYPRALKVKNRESKIKFIHDQLRNKLQLQFPEDKQLKQKKTIFDRASERHKKRNQIILQDLEGTDSQLKPLQLISSIPSGKIQKKEEQKQEPKRQQISQKSIPTPAGPAGPSLSDFQRLKKQILEVNVSIDTLCDSQAKIDAKINKITSFAKKYESQLENANLTNDQFDEIFSKADLLTERMGKLTPQLDRYRSKEITFNQLYNIIHNKKAESPKKKQEALRPESKNQIERPSLNVSETSNLPKIDSPTLKSSVLDKQKNANKTSLLQKGSVKKEEEKKLDSSRKKIEDITPIKKVKEEFDDHEKFEDSKDMSSLPEMSRKSIEIQKQPSLGAAKLQSNRHLSQQEGLNIQPASHTILDHSKASAKNVPSHKQIKVDDEALKLSFKKAVAESPVEQAHHSRQLIDSKGHLSRLSEEIEHNIQINLPKSIKNAAGSYKFKHQQVEREPSLGEKHPITTPQSVLKGQDSRKSSKIKFEESKVSHPQMIQEEDDMILLPDTNPLETSFHDLKATDEDFKLQNELSFKKCFEDDKYLFGVDRYSKKFKLATDTLNLIKRPDSARKHSRTKQSTISIPNILNERNKKFQQEIKYIEEKKNRKISELQNKIKLLETTGSVMKERIVQQEKEIRHIKAFSEADNSRVKKNSILEDQDAIFKAKLASVHNRSIRDRSLFEQSRKDPRCLDPQGTLINCRKYYPYFQQFKLEKQKKNLLKNKELLLKNDSIEFGCMSRRQKLGLSITFYITPGQDLDGLVSRVISSDSNLQIQLQPKHIPSIRRGKQEKVVAFISIKNIPYYLPEIEFTYNMSHKMDTQRFLIPCSFQKFIHLPPTDQREILRHFQKNEKVFRGEEVPYSKKLLKNIANLSDYLGGGVLLKGGEMNHNGEMEFGGRALWDDEQFWVRVMIRPNQFLYVQTACAPESAVASYYVSLITNLLMKNIQLQQM